MDTTLDSGTCDSGLLHTEPFRSVRVRFGMLLGQDDFETMTAYHRGKMWLHNAWLHGAGAVWGLGVETDPERGEIRVGRGLALDGIGRELLLERDACVDVQRWFEENATDPDLVLTELEGGSIRFDAHVVIQSKACLARQVPALVEPCEGSGNTTTYSRVVETVELFLRPGVAPDRPAPYHRLRLLFGLDSPLEEEGAVVASDQEVLDARAEILGRPPAERTAACLEAFRRFAALDEIDLAPAPVEEGETEWLFPVAEPAPVALANVTGITLSADGPGGRTLVSLGDIDTSVRPTHVATSTVQELCRGSQPGTDDAGGPRVVDGSVAVNESRTAILFRVTGPLNVDSLAADAFHVTRLTGGGWTDVAIAGIGWTLETLTVLVSLSNPLQAGVHRLVVEGTGARPVLGQDVLPFAGAVDDPPATAHKGNDFEHMLTIE